MLPICTILFVICYLVKFFSILCLLYYQIGEIKLYIMLVDYCDVSQGCLNSADRQRVYLKPIAALVVSAEQ